MDAPRALVFRPLVKGNEALGTNAPRALVFRPLVKGNEALGTFPELRSPRPTVGKRELWEHPFSNNYGNNRILHIRFHCAVRSLHLWYLWRMPEMMLPELSFSDRWSRGTKLWERDCSAPGRGEERGLGLLSRLVIRSIRKANGDFKQGQRERQRERHKVRDKPKGPLRMTGGKRVQVLRSPPT